jgi:hypothetical protein
MMPTPQTTPNPSSNRRISRRKGLRRPCVLTLSGRPPRELRVSTWDLGVDGMCLLSSKPITPGTRCDCAFELPGSDVPLHAAGKVVYSSYVGVDGFRIGVVFGPLDEPAASEIQSFVDG